MGSKTTKVLEGQRLSAALQPSPPWQPGCCPVTTMSQALVTLLHQLVTRDPTLQMRKQTPGGSVACIKSPSVSGNPAQAVRAQGRIGVLGRRQGLRTEGIWAGGQARGSGQVWCPGRLSQRGGLARPRGRPWRRQFPPRAHSVLFNLELKCKQGSVPAAPAPNQIRCYDFSAGRRPAFRGGSAGVAGMGARPNHGAGAGGDEAICLGQPDRLAGIFHPN